MVLLKTFVHQFSGTIHGLPEHLFALAFAKKDMHLDHLPARRAEGVELFHERPMVNMFARLFARTDCGCRKNEGIEPALSRLLDNLLRLFFFFLFHCYRSEGILSPELAAKFVRTQGLNKFSSRD